jgi:hypothetical protein
LQRESLKGASSEAGMNSVLSTAKEGCSQKKRQKADHEHQT